MVFFYLDESPVDVFFLLFTDLFSRCWFTFADPLVTACVCAYKKGV